MRILSIFLLLLILLGCSVSERQDWKFMESVGGLTIVGQDKNPNWLIIRGDVSGVKEFSHKPTQLKSAIAVKEVEAIVQGATIQLYVVTTLVSDKYPNTEISGVNISGAKKGTCLVQYVNPDGTTVDLKQITIY